MRASSLRVIWVASPPPLALTMGFAALTVLAAWMLYLDPGDARSPLAAVLYLQMFAAASGFTRFAGRGHYDPLLVSGRHRWSIGLAHWAAAAAPGIFVWMAIGALETALAPEIEVAEVAKVPDFVAFQPASLVALALVSSLSWTTTLALPRLSGGVLWTALLVAVLTTREGFVQAFEVTTTAPINTFGAGLRLAAAGAVCPFLLLSPIPAAWSVTVLLADIALAAFVLGCGVAYVARRDYPLVEQ